LSPEFSYDKAVNILEEVNKISQAYIVYNMTFHPKVYLFENIKDSKLIFGSSNFTYGGIEKNIEFDLIKDATVEDETNIKMFFEFCQNNSKLVDEEIIESYKQIEDEIQQLKDIQLKIRKKINNYENKNDDFESDTYNINDYYFKYEDYVVLFPRNQFRNDVNIMSERKKLQSKMLDIHDLIYKDIKNLNLNCHWRNTNVTSLIQPCIFNKHNVGWIGVRYGKTKKEIDQLNYGLDKDEELGFQKNACLQYCITSSGFEVSLFHAVPYEAIDRDYLHKKLTNENFKNELVTEIKKLKYKKFMWIINNPHKEKPDEFDFDKNEAEDFIKFYNNNDIEGTISLLTYYLEPDDIQIKDIQSITKLIVDRVKMLIPIYKLISFRL